MKWLHDQRPVEKDRKKLFGLGTGKGKDMATKKHLIIGCGSAALTALGKIRSITLDDEVKLVTMDDYPPCSPASLPYLLSGRITEAEIWMKGDAYFKNLRSTLTKGKEVTQVLPEEKEVIYRDGHSESYDTLLIASGSEPIKPPIKGFTEAGIQGLRTLADCRRLLWDLEKGNKVAILGAGMVGMKIAAALIERGYQVSMIEKEERILAGYFNEEAEVYIRDIFLEHEARFFTGKGVIAIERGEGVLRIILADGSSVNADILINAAGVRSRVSFMEETGVRIGNGILVDRRMSTGIDDIYAAGDVAEAQDFFTGKPKINAVLYSAVSQGRVAGANMAGVDDEYEGGIPVAVFNFLGNRAFSIGLATSKDNTGQVFRQKDGHERKFKKLIFREDALVGGMALNEEMDPGLILYLIRRRADMTPFKEALFEGTKPLSNPWLSSLRFLPNSG
jgi:phenylglyoxylate dehydrogenase epsilon subunit